MIANKSGSIVPASADVIGWGLSTEITPRAKLPPRNWPSLRGQAWAATPMFARSTKYAESDTRNLGTHSKVKLAYIGLLSGYPICLGLNGENSDKIFFPGDNIYENGLIKLADNIFEFCKKFTFTIDPEYINPSNLYKNWNEDIWRIKPPDFRDSRRYELLDKDSLDKRYNELKKSKADLSEIESEYRIRGFDLPKKFLFW